MDSHRAKKKSVRTFLLLILFNVEFKPVHIYDFKPHKLRGILMELASIVFIEGADPLSSIANALVQLLIIVVVAERVVRKLYSFIRPLRKVARDFLISTHKSISLPEPYPRLRKTALFFTMSTQYLGSLTYILLSLLFIGLIAFMQPVSVFTLLVAMLTTLVFIYFAMFFFAQAEHIRVFNFREN